MAEIEKHKKKPAETQNGNSADLKNIIPPGYASIGEYIRIPKGKEAVPVLDPKGVQAILFDLDGTLIDTEHFYRACWPRAAADYGFAMTDEQALSLRSLGRPFAIAYMTEMLGEGVDYHKLRERRKELVNERIAKEGILPKPNAAMVLTKLRQAGYRLAVTTANDLERTVNYLKKVDLDGYFDELVCATMVKQGKPAPDIYEYACERLGISPEHACVVEDSPNGVLSAYRAGCPVVMIPDQTEPEEDLQKLLALKPENLTEFCEYMVK